MVEEFPLIEVGGPPRERGRQYGRQAAERIALGVAHYTAQLERAAFDREAIRALVYDYSYHLEVVDSPAPRDYPVCARLS